MLGGRVPPGREQVGEAVAAFPTYEAAQKAVSSLIAADVPARDIAIVGQGLRSIERVTGRLGYGAAARSGAVSGLMLGLLFSFIFVLGNPNVSISVFIGVLLVGVAIGMLLNIITFAAVRRRRDFASVMQVIADRYEVCVLPTSIQKARGALGPANTVAVPPPVAPAQPGPSASAPQYGERLPVDSAPPRYGERVTPPIPGSEATSESDATPAPDAPAGPATPGSPDDSSRERTDGA